MGAIIRVHHPNLTPEEKAIRMEQIKEATIRFHKEVQKNEKSKKMGGEA
jgi:hypothetical protein